MPSLSPYFFSLLKADYREYPTFVESGTYEGGTIFAMEPFFKQLYTIEFSDYYYETTKSKYTGNKITFIHGDSGEKMSDLIPQLCNNTIFFLDGHWSSGNTGRSKKDCPLFEEISTIATFPYAAILIIDDFRLFEKGTDTGLAEDWSQITKTGLLDLIKDRIDDTYHLPSDMANDDRLVVHLKSIII